MRDSVRVVGDPEVALDLYTANGMVRRRYDERGGVPMQLHTNGIDLGKTVFHVVGLNLRGEVVVRKKFSRKQLLHFTANL